MMMMKDTFLLATLLSLQYLSILTNGKIVPSNGCDIYQGNWVYDDSYPLYDAASCPFIESFLDCQKNGRKDKDYLKYKWQPTGCELPRFDSVDFLAKMKGKKLIFIRDSISLNQWQSLTCMLHVAVPQAQYISKRTHDLSNFTFPAYDVSILFLRNAFLVDITTESRGRVLRLDSLSTNTTWGGADVMIFDSWHWWLHNGRKQPWDLVIHGNSTVKDMDRMTAYEIALRTWAKWIDSNVDPQKSKVFFQGVSPDHSSGLIGSNETCEGKTAPLKDRGAAHPAELVLEKVLEEMSKPVNLLNITTLSQLRIDGHPSVYNAHGGSRNGDCTHWCLAGVPDIWNQFFYASL